MIRVAFTLIGGMDWTGGYNYLLNLVQALVDNAFDRVTAILFFGTDIDEKDVMPFLQMSGVLVIRSSTFDKINIQKRLRQALLTGCDEAAAKEFVAQRIDVVFESAQFYGWRFPFPAVAWITDFQHRHLKHLFDFKGYWKREIGFRVQILSGRHVMLSSNDARRDCEQFYPASRGRTHVVHFAVPTANTISAETTRSVVDSYGLPEGFFFLPNQFWVHKNHECVILALKILKARGREFVIAVSGKQIDPRSPDHFPRLYSQVVSGGLEQNFRLLGLIPREHIPVLMRSCAALINPSTFEGWSTTVEEGKAMGVPMILSSLRVHKEQIDNALFFDPTSPAQLADILDDFSSVGHEDRLKMSISAAQQSLVNIKIFVNEFVRLIEFIANKK